MRGRVDPSDRAAMRERVNRWGIRVECLLCDWTGRHRPESDGRLRERFCEPCGVRSLRSTAWVKTHAERVFYVRSELVERSRQGSLDLSVESLLPALGMPRVIQKRRAVELVAARQARRKS